MSAKWIALAAVIAGIAFAAAWVLAPASTPRHVNEAGEVLPNSIASIEAIELNGSRQWLIIRGKDVANPVLLFLHGGPGTPETAFLEHYNRELEADFVVVSWEQRGAGKSYAPDIPAHTMTMRQFIADAHALTQHLKARFRQERIYLAGHSWGTLIGIRTVAKYPDDYHAYIAIAQTSNSAREEALIHDWVTRRAQEDGNHKALRQLDDIGRPSGGRIPLEHLSVKLKWVDHYGGAAFHGRKGYWRLVWLVLTSRAYTLGEKLRYPRGEQFSLAHLYGEISDVNLFDEITALELPVYFLHGRHDYQVPHAAAKEFFDHLKAPSKRFVTFEDSAHGVLFEEPEKFHRLMREIVAETRATPRR